MKRNASEELRQWLKTPARRPLVVRGARQVGKTWLVRDLARLSGRELIELNFERDPNAISWFANNDPRLTLEELSVAFDRDIESDRALLFLDEVQAAPSLLGKLRWFAEELAELPVVAAGSLLEFAVAKPAVSMPVGRVSYCWLPPMSFPEFLEAHGQRRLLRRLEGWEPPAELPHATHERSIEWLRRFAMVGGMPAVLGADVAGQDARAVRRLQVDLVATYRDDFSKYAARTDPRSLDLVLQAAVAMLGRKFVASKVGEGIKHQSVYRAMELLGQARLCTEIIHTAANGLPLGGEVNPRLRKYLLLDVGLVHGLLGTPAGRTFPPWSSLAPQVRSALTEQVVGQELHRLTAASDGRTRLYYWQREGGRSGEVDYLAGFGARIVPLELKSGATGAMKSLHQFMADKRLKLAVRFDSNAPSVQRVDVRTTKGDQVKYRLLNLPHYLAWRVEELIRTARRG